MFASESTILAVSKVQRIFLYLSDTNTDRLDIDVCGVLVLTVCEHLLSRVLIQCINTTFCQVFNTKHSQRRGVDVLMLRRARCTDIESDLVTVPRAPSAPRRCAVYTILLC